MALVSAGFPGEVDASEFSQLIGIAGHDGVVGMNVSPSGLTRTVTVATGRASLSGLLAINTSEATVQLPANNASSARIDRVVVRGIWTDSTLEFGYVQGTPSSNPQPPAITQKPGDHYELTLAQVRVAPGTGGFQAGDVTRENTPPSQGFYRVTNRAQMPDPNNGSLVYYTANNTLSIGEDGAYQDLASRRTAFQDMPNKPPNWTNTSGWYVKSGVVYMQFSMVRTGNGLTNTDVILGQLPSSVRPDRGTYGTMSNRANGRAYTIEITTGGLIRGVNMTVSTGHRITGTVVYPL